MAYTGGRMPYDAAGALAGPARVLYAELAVVPTPPTGLWDIVPAVANAQGEYPPMNGWKDFGLAADAPTYTHSKDTEGLEYQQPKGELFQQISDISRTFTAQVAQIDADNLKIIENTANVDAIASGAGHSALTKVPFGLYQSLRSYRIALVSYRPDGSAVVTEPAPSNVVRPPAVALVLPTCTLSAEDTELEFDKGSPVNCAVTFTAIQTPGLDAGEEHGYWILEAAGAISAA
jgi:hypothetical protein